MYVHVPVIAWLPVATKSVLNDYLSAKLKVPVIWEYDLELYTQYYFCIVDLISSILHSKKDLRQN